MKDAEPATVSHSENAMLLARERMCLPFSLVLLYSYVGSGVGDADWAL
jgi:hypothetical protein